MVQIRPNFDLNQTIFDINRTMFDINDPDSNRNRRDVAIGNQIKSRLKADLDRILAGGRSNHISLPFGART